MSGGRELLRRAVRSLRHALRPDAGSMVLRQTMVWSRAILWTIVLVAVGVVVWAFLAPMDEVVRARGKLEPLGAVQDVQAPLGGVVDVVLVAEGDTVSKGEVLVRLDDRVARADVLALEQTSASLEAQRSFYGSLLGAGGSVPEPEGLPPEVADLAKNRSALIEESSILRRLRDEVGALHAAIVRSEEGAEAGGDEVVGRLAALERMASGVVGVPDDLAHFFNAEVTDLVESYRRLRSQLGEARKIEANKLESFRAFASLQRGGNLSRVDELAHEAAWLDASARVKDLEDQAKNLVTSVRTRANDRLADNRKRLAEVDANLVRLRLDNLQRLSEVTSRLEAARRALENHAIAAPSDGVVFEIVSNKPGSVLATKDVVLKIVPTGELIAKVDVTNSDIGFIRADPSNPQRCEVEVDTFPKREFGDIDGEVVFVGSDALPPDEVRPFYSFPVKVSLDRQFLMVRGKEIALQSGMSVSVNIKIRKRRVVNIFLDNLLGPVESLREVR